MRALTPGRIGQLETRNRFVRAATSESMATSSGAVTPALIELHRTLAGDGVGLSLLGHAFVEPRGQSLPNQTGIHDDSMLPGLRNLTDAVHAAGGLIFAQLAHAGSQSGMPGNRLLAPSPVPNALTGSATLEAAPSEIETTISSFATAAGRAVVAGFDGVHIHAANGYLISTFNSPYANRRVDEWGGDAGARSAFVSRVYGAIREAVGPRFPITMKLGMEDAVADGLTLAESIDRVKALAEAGLDGVEVSVGVMAAGADSCHKYVAVDRRRALADHLYHRVLSQPASEAYFEPWAKAVRAAAPGLAVLLVGGLRTTQTIERVLDAGSCDFVCLARPLIREPSLVAQITDGRRGQVDCTSCNMCLDNEGSHPLQCWRTPRTRLIHGAVAHVRRGRTRDRH